MSPPYNILAVDIGSVSIGIVEINASKEIVNSTYVFHQGKIVEELYHILQGFDLSAICGIATTTSTPSIIRTNGALTIVWRSLKLAGNLTHPLARF